MVTGSAEPGTRRRVRVRRLLVTLISVSTAVGRCASPPSFADAGALEQFVLPAADDGVKSALEAALTLEGAGNLIGLAVKMGPAYATKVASLLADPGFREGYRDVARYLDMFGSCQKKQAGATEGWWSNYPDPPSENYCVEATKLLFSALMWNQVHYCGRLASGEDKPRVPVPSGKQPPYRLDEPPVATQWLRADALYAITDAALRFGFAKTLRARAELANERVRAAMLTAASELERETPNREMAALAIAKLLVRRYEQTHIEHLARINAEPAAKPH
jgi:hypothetical protein